VLVITQAPMMIRSFGLSSTFKAMPGLRCRSGASLPRAKPGLSVGFGSRLRHADAFEPTESQSFPIVVNAS
jgi:hypothetical protein